METDETTGAPVHRLLDYISRSGFRTGHRLPRIKDLAGELRLAPHAVRDALLQAQTMGLVDVRPRSGCFVQSVDFRSMVDVFSQSLPQTLTEDRNLFDLLETRRLIEVELAGLAAARRRLADLAPLREATRAMYESPDDYQAYMMQNEQFHLGIAQIVGNQVLLAMLRSLMVLLRPTLGSRQPATWKDQVSHKREKDAREHEAIFQALLMEDPAAARAAMAAHLRDTAESLLRPPPSGDRSTS